MITFAAPAFLAGGALLALGPLVLHMLARTPPERRPLPTARFLEPDPRTRLRLRRPADLLLLALRVAFLVLLGAAFARPAWVPQRDGGGRLVLLDAGAGMAPAWEEAIAVAADRLGEDGTLVVFDTAARFAGNGARTLDSLAASGPADVPSSYLAALRGLRLAGGALPVDSATAVLVTRPRWGAWSPAVPVARDAAWPARIEVAAVGAGAASALVPEAAQPARRAMVVDGAAHALRPYAASALGALGYDVREDGGEIAVVLPEPGSSRAGSDRVEGSRGVVVLGGRPVRGGDSVWSDPFGPREGPLPSRGRLVLADGQAMDGWGPLGGRPAAGARVVAVWEDGRAAAVAGATGDRCTAYLAAEPVAAGAAADPAFPHLIAALADACVGDPAARPDGQERVPLDGGALAVLTRDSLPRGADLSALTGETGRPLTRILLALALVVALAELAAGYIRGTAR